MKLTHYQDVAGFTALRDEWNDLLHHTRFDTLFLTWEWQTHWWACIGSDRGSLHLLAARDDAGRLVGILPLYRVIGDQGPSLNVVGCVEVSDYLDLIVAAGHEEAVYGALLDWLDGPNAPDWTVLNLCNQPDVSPARHILPDMARARGWAAEVQQEDVCPIVALPDSWEAYLEGLDKKQRHEIRRKLRRIEREVPDFSVRLAGQGRDLALAVEQFIALHRLSSRDKDAFMTPQMQEFFHDIARVCAERGWLRLGFLDIAGEPVASYFCFVYGQDLQIYNSGYRPGAYEQLSPGWVLLAALIQEAIAEGRARVDFLQGNEDYKYRFGGVDSPVYRTQIYRG